MSLKFISILYIILINISSLFAFSDKEIYIRESKLQAVPENKITVKGQVVDFKGTPISGAVIIEDGTKNIITSDEEGYFSLSLNSNAKLSVYSMGYETIFVSVGNQAFIKIVMKDVLILLDEVVVTAMGIKRKSSSLTYSVQQIAGDYLTRNKELNLITSLAGKVAGVNIQKSSGLGGSAKVNIRGSRSAKADGNNQPLYVIDGVPMQNSAFQDTHTALGGTNNGANTDYGDGISNLNSEDIESVSILKGASAAALYGSQAANGVILITTKRGHAGSTIVNFSSNLTFDTPFFTPEFQNTYGTGSANSWGVKGEATGHDNLKDYFSIGTTAINTISLSTGNEKAQEYFSYANTTARGIIDNNTLTKHNLSFHQTNKLFNDRINLTVNLNLLNQKLTNPTPTGGYYLNPLVGLYRFPRGLDMSDYSGDNVSVNYPERNIPIQNWYASTTDNESNPYWLKHHTSTSSSRNRVIASLKASLKIMDCLDIQARGTMDHIGDRQESTMDASTVTNLTTNSLLPKYGNGRYRFYTGEKIMTYGDLIATFNPKWKEWSLSAIVGGSITINKADSRNVDSGSAGLINANVFQLSNIIKDSNAKINENINSCSTMQSIFTTNQIGYKGAFFLDITARNDWSSTLAYTKSLKSGFFYPSIGFACLLHKSLELPEWFNFAKMRASFAEVGNDLPIYASTSYDKLDAGGDIITSDTFSEDLKPEISTSWELGFESKFFQNAIDIDFTWYKTLTTNQLLRVDAPTGSPMGYQWINAGKISNKGFEITLGVNPFNRKNFSWRSQFNFSTNKNEIIELYHDPINPSRSVTQFVYGNPGFASMNYMMIVKEGGSLGDLYGRDFVRDDNGKIKVSDDTGLPQLAPDLTKAGNNFPDAMLGWINNINIHSITIGLLIDARIGGDVMSFTQADIDYYGASKATGDARDRAYVELEGERYTNVKGYYEIAGGMKGATNQYVYDVTNIRIRELSIGYSFPSSWMDKSKVFKDIRLTFVARNLLFLYKNAPFDPDASMAAGNYLQGVDVFGMPTTRNLGFNVKFTL